ERSEALRPAADRWRHGPLPKSEFVRRYGTTQLEQHVLVVPTIPPAFVQWVASRLIEQVVPSTQLASVRHTRAGFSTQVPVVRLQVPSRCLVHVTKPAFPHVDLAAHRVIFPLQSMGIAPLFARLFTWWATQLT